jgi:hypothetical protein
MPQLMKTFSTFTSTTLLALVLMPIAQAAHHEEADATAKPVTNGRAIAVEMEAVVTAIDLETRQVSLQGPGGQTITVSAREKVVKLEDVSVGDILLATYFAALEGELRAPTEEELANPWVVVEQTGESQDSDRPGIGAARVIRAVVTIEGMNRILGTVTVKDARGILHLIGAVEPEKMEGVTLGQTAVLEYTEALALSLEIKGQAAE